jgi:hypothetical protein
MYDRTCHHLQAFGYVTNKARISDGGNHAQLSQQVRSKR